MPPAAPVPPDEAVQALDRVYSARAATRGQLRSYSYPLIVFGALTMLSTPFFSIWEGAGVAAFWLVAAPAGALVVARQQRAREITIGAGRASRSYAVTATALVLACFGLGMIGSVTDQVDVSRFGPPLAISIAYLVFSRLERSVALAALASVAAALTIVLAVTDVEHAVQILTLTYGASFLTLGVITRSNSQRT